jgi:hypothetical protein
MEVLVVLDWFATVPSIIRHERIYVCPEADVRARYLEVSGLTLI